METCKQKQKYRRVETVSTILTLYTMLSGAAEMIISISLYDIEIFSGCVSQCAMPKNKQCLVA